MPTPPNPQPPPQPPTTNPPPSPVEGGDGNPGDVASPQIQKHYGDDGRHRPPIGALTTQQEPIDLLHGLQQLVLGPQHNPTKEEEDEDLEAQYGQGDASGAIDETISSSATDLKQARISFLAFTRDWQQRD
ncbi:hypothetical protein Salat_1555200 [Sesamum alatum]|uniref:Uncharacterized protein n=1 Tax=Sesamum alatum TaxID=300844 RepID=A0AAE2CMP9_9LAMI|nr:hypothetical protein Salat_1555200 [Sesamum alatum]